VDAIVARLQACGAPITGHQISGETRAQPGVTRHWLENWTLVRDSHGVSIGYSVLVEEVTADRVAQERLRASDARFRASQELALDAFTILQAVRQDARVVDFLCEYANPKAHMMLKAPRLQGHRLSAMLPGNITHPLLFKRYVDSLTTGEPSQVDLYYDADGVKGWFWNAVTRLDGERVAVWFKDITSRKQAEEHRKFLTQELSHRVKNTLALAMAIVRQTLPRDDSRTELEQRLSALGGAHQILIQSDWSAADLEEVVRRTLQIVQNERIVVAGPAVKVPPRAAVHLAIAIHELATNAVKHGSLSNAVGTVQLTWTLDGSEFRLEWRECDGPPVTTPASRGFGSAMLQRALPLEVDGKVEMDFDPSGLRCTIIAPLSAISGAHAS
jgi:two-component sensor histidine kinase